MKADRTNKASFFGDSANMPVLLLTAAVDARNGRGCLFSTEERRRQYLHAFEFYMRFLVRNQDICKGVVFCENSGADLSPFKVLVPETVRERVEFVSLDKDAFRPEMGKSYNEMLTLDMAVSDSSLLREDGLFLKLTGRYPIWNIRRLVRDLVRFPDRISVCCFHWPAGRWLSRHPPLVDTRCIAIRKSVWEKSFKGLYETADHGVGRHFETIAEEVSSLHADDLGWVQAFSRPPLILGKQGGVKRIAGVAIPKTIEPVFLFATYCLHWLQLVRRGRSSFHHDDRMPLRSLTENAEDMRK